MLELDGMGKRDKHAIEITPAMIAAGEDALCLCDDTFSSKPDLGWVVTSVFRAMYETGAVGALPLGSPPTAKPKFDRTAYQREYMRKRRAKAKELKQNDP